MNLGMRWRTDKVEGTGRQFQMTGTAVEKTLMSTVGDSLEGRQTRSDEWRFFEM